jgi:hypothetical protein
MLPINLAVIIAAVAVLVGISFNFISIFQINNVLIIRAIKDKMRETLLRKEKHEAAYRLSDSEATATKPSSSDSTTVSGLMAFLRGLRLAMKRTREREKKIGW